VRGPTPLACQLDCLVRSAAREPQRPKSASTECLAFSMLPWRICMERIAQDQAAEPVKAIAYMRTSSATNVGADRQREAPACRHRALRQARRHEGGGLVL
jgi:hypothetical protein